MKKRRATKGLSGHVDLDTDILGTDLDDVLEEFEFNALPYQPSKKTKKPTREMVLLAKIARSPGK